MLPDKNDRVKWIERTEINADGEATRAALALLPDSLHQLPLLLAWAEEFNLAGEIWMLEGAIRTMSLWHQDVKLMDSLDMRGFHPYCAVETLSGGEEKRFRF